MPGTLPFTASRRLPRRPLRLPARSSEIPEETGGRIANPSHEPSAILEGPANEQALELRADILSLEQWMDLNA